MTNAYSAIAALSSEWAFHQPMMPAFAARVERFMAGEVGEYPQPRISGGLAIIPLIGAMTPRGDMGTLSTMRMEAQFREAVKNPGIKAIMFDVDSPGGAVYFTPQLAKRIYDSRGSKPIVAFGNGTVGSAAYWVATAADKLYLAPGAEAGSVGVFVAHMDQSKALEAAGVKVSVISYGDNKLEGSEFEPLSEETRQVMQARVNEMGEEFTSDLARHRKTTVASVRKDFGQGRLFGAKEAVTRGMADGVKTSDQVMRELMGATQVSAHSRRMAADADLELEWKAASERLFVAESVERDLVQGLTEFVGEIKAGHDPDILRRKLKLKEGTA